MIGTNTANASTSEFIGVIGAAIGDIKNQNNEKLINGSKIFYGDTIISEAQSNAQILNVYMMMILEKKVFILVMEYIYL